MSQILKFAVNQIVIGKGTSFHVLDYATLLPLSDTDTTKIGAEVVSIAKVEANLIEDRFLSIYFEAGQKYPYPDIVVDTGNMNETDNPRSMDQIELSEQYFALIDDATQKIYLEASKVKPDIPLWLRKKFAIREKILIKPLIVEKDFIDRIQSVSEISMTVVPNLFNAAGGNNLSQALKSDVLGYGAEEATLKLKYRRKPMKALREKTRELLDHKSEFKEITIVGKDVDGLESIFNTSEIVNKISILTPEDSQTRKYIPTEVFSTLIAEIKKLNEK